MADAVAELRAADATLATVIDQVGTDWLASGRRTPADVPRDRYALLIRSIAGQQVSTAAANAIFTRLSAYFAGHVPSPAEILAAEPEAMRVAAGLSHAKVRYLRSLAEHVADGRLQLERLDELDDEEVTRALTAVTGLGRWSADLFLMFALGRPDVVAAGDLGIRRAIRDAYGYEAMPTIAAVDALALAWRPHRTLACEFLWRWLRITPV